MSTSVRTIVNTPVCTVHGCYKVVRLKVMDRHPTSRSPSSGHGGALAANQVLEQAPMCRCRGLGDSSACRDSEPVLVPATPLSSKGFSLLSSNRN